MENWNEWSRDIETTMRKPDKIRIRKNRTRQLM